MAMTDAEILLVLAKEHEHNENSDLSYGALNCRLDGLATPESAESAALDFIDRLICDGVIRTKKLLQLAVDRVSDDTETTR